MLGGFKTGIIDWFYKIYWFIFIIIYFLIIAIFNETI